eukprot:GGOE01019137.1.p1 GENE.GGOE01019137.1~~GGOE01019137.1.p1  ORF type:complete len:552 (-),score=106.34 GGOE01019137.1:240-1895(-)
MALPPGELGSRVLPMDVEDAIEVQLGELGEDQVVDAEPPQKTPLRDSWVAGSIDLEEAIPPEPTPVTPQHSAMKRQDSIKVARRPPFLSPPPERPSPVPDITEVLSGGSSDRTSPPHASMEKFMPFAPHIPTPHDSFCSADNPPLSPASGLLRPLPRQFSSGPNGTPPPERFAVRSPLPTDSFASASGPPSFSHGSRPVTPPLPSALERLHPVKSPAMVDRGMPRTPSSAAKYQVVDTPGSKAFPMQGPFLLNGQMRTSHTRQDSNQCGTGQLSRYGSSVSIVSPHSSKRPNSAPPSLPVVVNADFSVTMERMEECIVRVGCIKFLVPTRLLKSDKASNLQRMLDGEWEDVADDHPDGSFSIKRNPTLFPTVLQVLQGIFTFPCADVGFLTSLLDELEFYDLQKAKAELLHHYPFLQPGAANGFAGGHSLRFDGMYFAIHTPSLSALAHDEFSCATPDNVVRAFRFKVNGSILRYRKHEKTTHVTLVLEEEGHYEQQPMQRVSCTFRDGSTCHFSRDANGILVLEFKLKAHKVVFHSDEEMVTWMRMRFPT